MKQFNPKAQILIKTRLRVGDFDLLGQSRSLSLSLRRKKASTFRERMRGKETISLQLYIFTIDINKCFIFKKVREKEREIPDKKSSHKQTTF